MAKGGPKSVRIFCLRACFAAFAALPPPTSPFALPLVLLQRGRRHSSKRSSYKLVIQALVLHQATKYAEYMYQIPVRCCQYRDDTAEQAEFTRTILRWQKSLRTGVFKRWEYKIALNHAALLIPSKNRLNCEHLQVIG